VKRAGRTGLLAALAVLGCSSLGEPGEPVAIEFLVPSPSWVEVGDTITLRARLLDQGGDSVDSGELRWRTPDTTVGVDSITGVFTGLFAVGTGGRVQPTAGSLVGPIVTFSVLAHADTLMVPAAAETLTVAAADSESTALGAMIAKFDATGLANRTMIIRLVTPLDGSVVLEGPLIPATANVLADTTLTLSVGSIGTTGFHVTVRGTRPDSAVVEFEGRHISDAPIAGSGQRIKIFFE
jgi:hypothetical protein